MGGVPDLPRNSTYTFPDGTDLTIYQSNIPIDGFDFLGSTIYALADNLRVTNCLFNGVTNPHSLSVGVGFTSASGNMIGGTFTGNYWGAGVDAAPVQLIKQSGSTILTDPFLTAPPLSAFP